MPASARGAPLTRDLLPTIRLLRAAILNPSQRAPAKGSSAEAAEDTQNFENSFDTEFRIESDPIPDRVESGAIHASGTVLEIILPNRILYRCRIYVILLNSEVLKRRSILRLNPQSNPLKPCVYVGLTGLPVDHRFENHRNGYKSAWVVRKYGLRLMPDLFEQLNPMPYEAAAQMEKELAEDLSAAGYTVTGGT
jgi:hypothetical protein